MENGLILTLVRMRLASYLTVLYLVCYNQEMVIKYKWINYYKHRDVKNIVII